MKTADDLEGYLLHLNLPYDTVEEGLWVLRDRDSDVKIVVRLDPPVVLFRLKLMDLPATGHEALFRLMLELNASEMMGGAYGLEGSAVVAVETLQAENLDQNEFQAAVDGLLLAANEHFAKFKQLLATRAQ